MSPILSASPAATFLRIRLMILPLLVLGRSLNMIISGVAKGPILQDEEEEEEGD